MKRKNKLIFFSACFLCLFTLSALAQNEAVTISAYYPSPYGFYEAVDWGNPGINLIFSPNRRGRLNTDNGSSIELGGGGSPYIDFSNDVTATDYDVRVFLQGNNRMDIDGGAPGNPLAASATGAGMLRVNPSDTSGWGLQVSDAGGIYDNNDGTLSIQADTASSNLVTARGAGGGAVGGGLQVRNSANSEYREVYVNALVYFDTGISTLVTIDANGLIVIP